MRTMNKLKQTSSYKLTAFGELASSMTQLFQILEHSGFCIIILRLNMKSNLKRGMFSSTNFYHLAQPLPLINFKLTL